MYVPFESLSCLLCMWLHNGFSIVGSAESTDNGQSTSMQCSCMEILTFLLRRRLEEEGACWTSETYVYYLSMIILLQIHLQWIYQYFHMREELIMILLQELVMMLRLDVAQTVLDNFFISACRSWWCFRELELFFFPFKYWFT